MKVKIRRLEPGQEPYAVLHVEEEGEDVRQLAKYIETEKYRGVRIDCYEGETIRSIQSRKIFYVESLEDVLYLHTAEGIFTSRKRLYEMEGLLPGEFIRVSKSAIMNVVLANGYRPLGNGLMLGEFPGGDAVYISRKYAKELRRKIKEGNLHG